MLRHMLILYHYQCDFDACACRTATIAWLQRTVVEHHLAPAASPPPLCPTCPWSTPSFSRNHFPLIISLLYAWFSAVYLFPSPTFSLGCLQVAGEERDPWLLIEITFSYGRFPVSRSSREELEKSPAKLVLTPFPFLSGLPTFLLCHWTGVWAVNAISIEKPGYTILMATSATLKVTD